MPAILDHAGRPYRLAQRRERAAVRHLDRHRIRASYDAAQTTTENVRHWAAADALSADAANSSGIRAKLRQRSRYEYANNAYCRGMVETLAADVIGTGPRLQILTGDDGLDTLIEQRFATWARAVKLAKKLRALRRAKCVDGEAFALFTDRVRPGTPVTLNVRPIEADRVTSSTTTGLDPNDIDGVRIDSEGEPIRYTVLREHPGGSTYSMHAGSDYDTYESGEVVHLFRQDRPEQHRGIPELSPALPLFAILRRYTLAELTAAETAADIAMALETGQPETSDYDYGPSGSTTTEPSAYETFDVFDLERGLVTVLPDGTKISQIKAEHPATTYAEFKREILGEAFASIVMPYIVGSHDSSEANYASGKLDRLTYGRVVRVEQSEWEIECLLPIVVSWWREARLVWPEFRAIPTAALYDWSVSWYWDEVEDIDPAKAASARKTNLDIGATTYPLEYARRGYDWETEAAKQARALGLSVEEYKRRLADKLLPAMQQGA